jgi:hypothetical protein
MGESGKTRLQRICSIAKYIVLAGIVLCLLILLGSVCLLVMASVDSAFVTEGLSREEMYFLLLISIINQIVSSILFYFLYQLSKSIGDGNSPFVSANVWLLKKMAILLLIGWIIGTCAGFALSVVWSLPLTGINGDALLMAGIIYVISLVFEYGVRLQEESDGFV